jgi:hypothetical protein
MENTRAAFQRDQAAPEESRGGPINYSDVDSADLVPSAVAVGGVVFVQAPKKTP